MKKIYSIAIIIASLLVIPNISIALQQVAGPLVLTVPIGESNTTTWKLFNDEDQTITVKVRVEGSVSDYISFPGTVDLPPKQFTPIVITASIPEDYDKSLGGKISGFLYVLQEGQSGQVQINVQMKKSITVFISGLPIIPEVETNVTTQTTTQQQPISNSDIQSGFFALLSGFNLPIFIGAIVFGVGLGLFLSKMKRR
jgi:hypothetical protein